ncbi:MAG TPA: hypothetical protein VF941_19835 [Clostridia bacterium]
MPAYIFIQCFIEYREDSFKYDLDRFRSVLQDINFNEQYLSSYIDNIKWELGENDFIYSGCDMPSETKMILNECFYVRPLIMGFTPKGYEGLKNNWVEFSLLLLEDEITKDYGTGEMHEHVKKSIWYMCNLVSKHFQDVPVFLTDELTDAKPWEAFIGLDDNMYSFDLAIVPLKYQNAYKNIPEGFRSIDLHGKKYISRMQVWGNEPWLV